MIERVIFAAHIRTSARSLRAYRSRWRRFTAAKIARVAEATRLAVRRRIAKRERQRRIAERRIATELALSRRLSVLNATRTRPGCVVVCVPSNSTLV